MLQKEDAERLLEILKIFTKNDTCQIDDSSFSLLFYQSKGVDRAQLKEPYYKELLDKKILIQEDELVYATVRVLSFRGNYFIVDSPYVASRSGLNEFYSNKDDKYGYIGDDGVMLLDYIIPKITAEKYQNGLDIGTGSGLIGISLLPWINIVTGIDITRPAINWAKLNAKMNRTQNYFPCFGNLYETAKNKSPFDFIVSNPSYSFCPPKFIEKYRIKDHEVSGDYGLELVFKIIDGFAEHLSDNGRGFICTAAPIIDGQEFLIDKIKEKYSTCKYSFTIHYNFIQRTPDEFKKYYRSCRINRLEFVFIDICNGQEFSIKKTHSKFYFASYFRLPFKVPSKLKHWIMKKILQKR
jgi:methylase of polypeptide subunit release factors